MMLYIGFSVVSFFGFQGLRMETNIVIINTRT